MQVERVGLHAVEFAIGAHFGLSLVKVRLGTGLTVQLLNVIGRRVEEIAVIGLLVGGGEASKDQYVFVGDLVEAAPLKTDPVGVLFDAEVQGLPQLTAAYVELLDQVGTLATIEASDHIQSLIVKRYGGMEIPPCVQASHLCPRVASHVIDLALVHAFARQGAPDGVDLTSAPTCQYARERVRPPLKDHVTPLLQPLVDELIARLGGLAGLSSSRQEDPSFFVLHTHEVRRNLDVDDV